MWVIFQKSDRKIVGFSAESDVDLDKKEALAEVVRGLVDAKPLNEYEAVEVKDRGRIEKLGRSVTRGRGKVQDARGGGLEAVDEEPEATVLIATTNAQGFHPVDNVPLLSNSLAPFLVITLQKQDEQGKPLTRKTKDNDEIWLRTDQGKLAEDKDPVKGDPPKEIRSVKLVSGTASFRLYWGPEKRLATVQMLSTDPDLRTGSVRVEFV